MNLLESLYPSNLVMTIRFNHDRMPADAIYDEQLNNAVLISSNANDSNPGSVDLLNKFMF